MQHLPHDCLAIIFGLSAAPAIRALKYTCKWISETVYTSQIRVTLLDDGYGTVDYNDGTILHLTNRKNVNHVFVGVGNGYGFSFGGASSPVEWLGKHLDRAATRAAITTALTTTAK